MLPGPRQARPGQAGDKGVRAAARRIGGRAATLISTTPAGADPGPRRGPGPAAASRPGPPAATPRPAVPIRQAGSPAAPAPSPSCPVSADQPGRTCGVRRRELVAGGGREASPPMGGGGGGRGFGDAMADGGTGPRAEGRDGRAMAGAVSPGSGCAAQRSAAQRSAARRRGRPAGCRLPAVDRRPSTVRPGTRPAVKRLWTDGAVRRGEARRGSQPCAGAGHRIRPSGIQRGARARQLAAGRRRAPPAVQRVGSARQQQGPLTISAIVAPPGRRVTNAPAGPDPAASGRPTPPCLPVPVPPRGGANKRELRDVAGPRASGEDGRKKQTKNIAS